MQWDALVRATQAREFVGDAEPQGHVVALHERAGIYGRETQIDHFAVILDALLRVDRIVDAAEHEQRAKDDEARVKVLLMGFPRWRAATALQ